MAATSGRQLGHPRREPAVVPLDRHAGIGGIEHLDLPDQAADLAGDRVHCGRAIAPRTSRSCNGTPGTRR